METYNIKSITESIILETNQKVIIVDLIVLKKEKYQINVELFNILAKTGESFNKRLVLDFNSMYAKELLEVYLENSSLKLRINEFIIIETLINNYPINTYYHLSVNVEHLIDKAPPFFHLKCTKTNGLIQVKFNNIISKSSIAISFKDICCYLKYHKQSMLSLTALENGVFEISVSKFQRELSKYEKNLISQRLFPSHEVSLINKGFSLSEIQQVLSQIQFELPDHIKTSLMYDVNFNTLEIRL